MSYVISVVGLGLSWDLGSTWTPKARNNMNILKKVIILDTCGVQVVPRNSLDPHYDY